MSRLVKQSFIYLSTEVLNKAIPFLLLPIITRYLTPKEYGIYSMYQVALSFLVPFIRMSLDIHITRNFFKVSKERLSQILSTILLLLHVNVLIGLFIVLIISISLKNPLGIPNNTIFIMPVIIYGQTINLFNLTILRNKEKPLHYGIIQIAITVLNFSSVIFLLMYEGFGWRSLIYGLLIANTIVAFYSLFSMIKDFDIRFKFYGVKEIFGISLPMIFHFLGSSVIFLSDRIFIQQMLGLKYVGIYSIGNQFGMITMIVINSIIMSVSPWMFKKLNLEEDIIRKLYTLMVIFLGLGIVIWISGLIVFPFVIRNMDYISGRGVIFWISLGFVFRGWYQVFHNIIVHEGQTNVFMIITIVASIINLLLNYFLIKSLGINGAAISTAFAFFFMFIATYFYSLKVSYLKLS